MKHFSFAIAYIICTSAHSKTVVCNSASGNYINRVEFSSAPVRLVSRTTMKEKDKVYFDNTKTLLGAESECLNGVDFAKYCKFQEIINPPYLNTPDVEIYSFQYSCGDGFKGELFMENNSGMFHCTVAGKASQLQIPFLDCEIKD